MWQVDNSLSASVLPRDGSIPLFHVMSIWDQYWSWVSDRVIPSLTNISFNKTACLLTACPVKAPEIPDCFRDLMDFKLPKSFLSARRFVSGNSILSSEGLVPARLLWLKPLITVKKKKKKKCHSVNLNTQCKCEITRTDMLHLPDVAIWTCSILRTVLFWGGGGEPQGAGGEGGAAGSWGYLAWGGSSLSGC